MAGLPARPQDHAAGQQRRDLHEELQRTADQHPVGQAVDRLRQPRAQDDHRRDDGQVEKDRRHRGRREVPIGIEEAAGQGHHPDEEEIREHPPRQRHRERKLGRLADEARGEQTNENRSAQRPGDGEQGQHQRHDGRHGARRPDRFGLPTLGQVVAEDRNEGDAHRPLRNEAPEQVGNPESHEERVRCRAGA
jgi:hypothetical protein